MTMRMSRPSWTQILLMMRIICRVSMSWRRSSPHWRREDGDQKHLAHLPSSHRPQLPLGGQPWPALPGSPPQPWTCSPSSHQVRRQRGANSHPLSLHYCGLSPTPHPHLKPSLGPLLHAALLTIQVKCSHLGGAYMQHVYVTKPRSCLSLPPGLYALSLYLFLRIRDGPVRGTSRFIEVQPAPDT